MYCRNNRDSEDEKSYIEMLLQPFIIQNVTESLTDDKIVTSREEIKKVEKWKSLEIEDSRRKRKKC